MLNRRKALIGYVTYMVARSLIERAARQKVEAALANLPEPPRKRSRLRRLPVIGAVVAVAAGAAVVVTRMRP
jgi:hypothetical protein